MKNGKKPTREQRKFLEKRGITDPVWLIVKDMPKEMVLIHREKNITKTIQKD